MRYFVVNWKLLHKEKCFPTGQILPCIENLQYQGNSSLWLNASQPWKRKPSLCRKILTSHWSLSLPGKFFPVRETLPYHEDPSLSGKLFQVRESIPCQGEFINRERLSRKGNGFPLWKGVSYSFPNKGINYKLLKLFPEIGKLVNLSGMEYTQTSLYSISLILGLMQKVSLGLRD